MVLSTMSDHHMTPWYRFAWRLDQYSTDERHALADWRPTLNSCIAGSKWSRCHKHQKHTHTSNWTLFKTFRHSCRCSIVCQT